MLRSAASAWMNNTSEYVRSSEGSVAPGPPKVVYDVAPGKKIVPTRDALTMYGCAVGASTPFGAPAYVPAAVVWANTGRRGSLYPCKIFMLSLIHISEPTRLGMISYAVFCL